MHGWPRTNEQRPTPNDQPTLVYSQARGNGCLEATDALLLLSLAKTSTRGETRRKRRETHLHHDVEPLHPPRRLARLIQRILIDKGGGGGARRGGERGPGRQGAPQDVSSCPATPPDAYLDTGRCQGGIWRDSARWRKMRRHVRMCKHTYERGRGRGRERGRLLAVLIECTDSTSARLGTPATNVFALLLCSLFHAPPQHRAPHRPPSGAHAGRAFETGQGAGGEEGGMGAGKAGMNRCAMVLGMGTKYAHADEVPTNVSRQLPRL